MSTLVDATFELRFTRGIYFDCRPSSLDIPDIRHSQWLVSTQCLSFRRRRLAAVSDFLRTPRTSHLPHADLRKEHLATVMKGGQTAGQFKESFIKANRALAPLGDSPAALLPPKSRFQSSALLRPRYICLSCSEPCFSNERRAHTEKTGHQFCMHPCICF